MALTQEQKEKIGVMILALEEVKAEANRRGFRKGSGGRGTMPCPVLTCKGQVTFAVATSNGHVRVACNAPGCMNWVE